MNTLSMVPPGPPPLLHDLAAFARQPHFMPVHHASIWQRVVRILRVVALLLIAMVPALCLLSGAIVAADRLTQAPAAVLAPEGAPQTPATRAPPRNRSVTEIMNSENVVSRALGNGSPLMLLVLAVLAAPLMEELAFRLCLKPSAWRIAVGTGMTLFFAQFIVPQSMQDLIEEIAKTQFALRVDPPEYLSKLAESAFPIAVGIAALLIAFLAFLLFSLPGAPRLTRFYERRFRWIFLLSAAAFALMHLQNYPNRNLWVAAPLLVLPQFLAGLALGYVRCRHGFAACVLMHACYNLALVVPAAGFATLQNEATRGPVTFIGIAICGLLLAGMAVNAVHSISESIGYQTRSPQPPS
jgi:hypothetical protein